MLADTYDDNFFLRDDGGRDAPVPRRAPPPIPQFRPQGSPQDPSGGWHRQDPTTGQWLDWDEPSQSWKPRASPPPPAAPAAAPAPAPAPGGGGPVSLGSLVAPFTQTFTPPAAPTGPPSWLPPAPSLQAPPAFHYPDFAAPAPFQAPTAADVRADPSYDFRLGQGTQALEQSAAARGVLRTGGTLKGFEDYGQNFASTEYGNVYGRKRTDYDRQYEDLLRTYQTNRGNAADSYSKLYQTALDTLQPQELAYTTTAAATQRQGENDYANAWQKYLQDYQIFRNQQGDTFEKQFRTATA